ncbi:hypothetical protein HZC07_01095 [Candidatus Micrarchaeota archaeon]|nr:hypothetical protein [Candidatus Micrarchaeota archaeon]
MIIRKRYYREIAIANHSRAFDNYHTTVEDRCSRMEEILAIRKVLEKLRPLEHAKISDAYDPLRYKRLTPAEMHIVTKIFGFEGEGQTIKDYANGQNITTATARARLNDGLKKLRAEIGESEMEGS